MSSQSRMDTTPMPAVMQDRQLVRQIAAGDRDAFSTFLQRHLDDIVGFARRYVHQQSDAEDIAQEAFLRVWKHARQFEDIDAASPRSWLYKISYHLCMDALRRRRPGCDIDELRLNSDPNDEPEQVVLRDARLQQLQQAMMALPVRQYSALQLCSLEGLSNQEAAQSMAISVEALESLLARARRNLRRQLQTE